MTAEETLEALGDRYDAACRRYLAAGHPYDKKADALGRGYVAARDACRAARGLSPAEGPFTIIVEAAECPG